MGVIKISEEIIYDGELKGTVTSEMAFSSPYNINRIIFSLKIEDNIEKIPKELIIIYSSYSIIIVRPGDKVKVDGKIKKKLIKQWNSIKYWFECKAIYNETLSFGIA
ncbi:MAG: hypothetical protein EAX96_08550 [Candidatus Lokiarchaeota archaeon]|nr:hypothetical protein [Candidatus Lokiarchaeota archaeon]